VIDPQIKSGEVLLKVCNAGICSSDISRVYGSGAYYYPIILGHEFSGIVKDVYNDSDKHWIGKNVGVFPLIPCFKCESCINGQYETCSNYSYIGSRQDGAFAEYVAVPVWNLIEIPKTINMELASLLEPAAVALHAVKRADLECVTRVAVFGKGIIGRLISMWLDIYGINDISLIGRDFVFSENVDLVFEVVGKTTVFEKCIESVRPNGQIILVGNPDYEFYLKRDLFWQILRRQLNIKGTWNSRFVDDWQKTMEKIQNGELNFDELITHKYSFKELDKALEMIHNNKEKRCKVIIEYN
jgi:L-iditol 2-dehydrogenase